MSLPDRALLVFSCMLGGAVLGLVAMHVFGISIGSNCSQPIAYSCGSGNGPDAFLLWVGIGGIVGLVAGCAISILVSRRSS